MTSSELPFHLGEYIKNKKSGIAYRINGFGRNRATGERYFILDNNSLLREKDWNKYYKML